MPTLERWLAVPFVFGVLFYVSVSVRWLAVSIERAQDAYGLGQVIGFQLLLGWITVQRIGVTFVLTLVSLPFVSPLRRMHVVYISCAAVVAEIVSELILGSVDSANASRTLQLIATAIGFICVLVASEYVLRMQSKRSADAA